MAGKYLEEFKRLNTTARSIYDLEDSNVLIVLEDGTNLTDWEDVKFPNDVIYISENLSGYDDLSRWYGGFQCLRAIVTSPIGDEVASMKGMFSNCMSLVDISALWCWDVSGVCSMSGMFEACLELTDLSPLAVWEVYNVEDMSHMFCAGREGKRLPFPSNDVTPPGLDDPSFLEFWGVHGKGDRSVMSGNSSSLSDLSPLADWDVSAVVTMEGMFEGCCSIVDASCLDDWDVSNVKSFSGMFDGCDSMEVYPKWYGRQ